MYYRRSHKYSINSYKAYTYLYYTVLIVVQNHYTWTVLIDIAAPEKYVSLYRFYSIAMLSRVKIRLLAVKNGIYTEKFIYSAAKVGIGDVIK